MKRLYEFITKANQILLFFGLLALIALAMIPAFEKVRSLDRPHVQVIAANADPAQTLVRDVSFLGQEENYFVFGIMKLAVGERSSLAGGVMVHQKMRLYGSADDDRRGQLVNVVYSDGSKIVKTLLPADGLVLRQDVSPRFDREKFPAHLFTCVTEDTNGDKKLDENDRQDLVVVDPSLKRPDVTIKSCSDFDLLPPHTLVAKVRTDDSLRFIRMDVTTGEQNEIAWK